MAQIPPKPQPESAGGCSPPAQSSVRGRPFQPGQSGNPAGRKPGVPDRRTRMAKAFAGEYDGIVQAIINKAKDGDMTAASLYLSRVEPPLRPKAERVTFKLDPAAPFADQAGAVLLAVSQGDLDPDTAKMLIDCISAAASLRKFDAFEAELALMREQMERLAMAGRGAGGVMFVDMNKERK
jgi:hypothetical protein